MTKKHFIELAKTIRLQYSQASTTKELRLIENIVDDLSQTLKDINGLFDSSRFKQACGIQNK